MRFSLDRTHHLYVTAGLGDVPLEGEVFQEEDMKILVVISLFLVVILTAYLSYLVLIRDPYRTLKRIASEFKDMQKHNALRRRP